jgi:hypothetical protein
MSNATIILSFVPKRLLTKSEAAAHCGRSVRQFDAECPVAPVVFQNGDKRFDINDLDKWIATLKGDPSDADAILARLAP